MPVGGRPPPAAVLLREALFPQGAERAPDSAGGDPGFLLKLGGGARPGFKGGEHEPVEGAHDRWLRCLPVEHDGEPDAGVGVAGGREAGLGDRLGRQRGRLLARALSCPESSQAAASKRSIRLGLR